MNGRSRLQHIGAPHERRAVLCAALGALCACVCGASRAFAEQQADDFVVIVNARNPLMAVEHDVLADIFLKKTTHWADGERTRPVDLPPASSARMSFSRAVIGRSVAAVRNYWQQRIFSGRDVPPPELDSDDAIMRYVAQHRGAVGYVSNAAKLAEVKALSVR